MHASLINSPGEDEDRSTVIIVIITAGKAGGVTSNDHARAWLPITIPLIGWRRDSFLSSCF